MSLPLWAAPDLYVGQLRADTAQVLNLTGENSTVQLSFSETIKPSVLSLIGKVPFVEVRGATFENGVLKTSQVPTIISGSHILEGQLTRNVVGDKEYFEINGTPVEFGRHKKVTGSEFDGKSREYFSGKSVRAVGVIENGMFTIQSIIRDNFFSADTQPVVDAGVSAAQMQAFDQNAIGFISKLVNRSEKSPSPSWYRKNIFTAPNSEVQVGDPVLLISISGAQGDSAGSINGHMAAGLGYVDKDFKIRGEMFNVYVTNEKEIVPGNVEMNDYFGHLVSGQLNYRPTYTVLLYGIAEENILKVKAELDRFHALFRQGSTKITPEKNCVTLTVQALADINIYGGQRNSDTERTDFKLLSRETELPPNSSLKQQFAFISKTKRAEFMPGPALISILTNLKHLNEQTNLGVTRADFVFAGQTPSARPNGGAPTTGIINQFTGQAKLIGKSLVKKVLKK